MSYKDYLTKLLNESISDADKKVVDSFYNGQPNHDGKILDTDGKSLDKMGLGSEQFAVWDGDKIKLTTSFSVKSDESIVRYIKKSIPKFSLAPSPLLETTSIEYDNSIKLAIRFINKLEDILKNGLPDGFDDVKEFLRNAISELPWQVDKFKKSVDYMKAQGEWPVISSDMEHNFDFDIDKYMDVKVAEMEGKLNGK
jgi:hypothetical protein